MNSIAENIRPRLLPPREARWRRELDGGTGRGVRIGILDTGVSDAAPELAGVVSRHFSVTRTGQATSVRRGEDEIGHGTACAWIVRQLAPESEISSVRVIGRSPREKGENLIAALRFAIGQGWDVINVSLGTAGFREPLEALADLAWQKGIAIVAAAHNDPERRSFPAALPRVLGVDAGAFESPCDFRFDETRSIEIEARGVYVRAPRPDGSWFHYTGSSFACPQVSGIVARLWERGIGVERLREKLQCLGRSV